MSPVYINLPDHVVDQIGAVMAEIPADDTPDFCSGIPEAGIPLAEAYGAHAQITPVEIFSKIQTPTGRKIVAKDLEPVDGEKIRIVDDMVTKGDTKLEAFQAAEELGYKVVDLVVLVDREQGAVDHLQKEGYTLRSAFTLDQLLRYGVRTERITQEQYDQVSKYLKPK